MRNGFGRNGQGSSIPRARPVGGMTPNNPKPTPKPAPQGYSTPRARPVGGKTPNNPKPTPKPAPVAVRTFDKPVKGRPDSFGTRTPLPSAGRQRMFADGGLVKSGMTAGAGGGLGRIEKSAAAGKGYKKGGMVKKGEC